MAISRHRLGQLTLPSPIMPHQAVRTASRSDLRVRGGGGERNPVMKEVAAPKKAISSSPDHARPELDGPH